MATTINPHHYHHSLLKRLFDAGSSLFGLIIFSPLFLVITLIIKLTSKGSVFFTQKRVGRNGALFKFLKFRTMRVGAEREQSRLRHLNEVYGPVFKIRDDPRFTKFGKFLARTGLDELPQLINVFKGEMSLVGPRPFPVSEARKLTKNQKVRELIKPGMTSSWVVAGAHNLSFKKWVQLDKEHVLSTSFQQDLVILLETARIVSKLTVGQILKLFKALVR